MTPQTEDLIKRLEAVESSSYSTDNTTCWHRNPDGPEAAQALRALQQEAPEWRSMDEAPRDRIIIAMCRYPTATAGSPDFVSWDGTDGWIYSRNAPERVVCWAWMPREILGDWPSEHDRSALTGSAQG